MTGTTDDVSLEQVIGDNMIEYKDRFMDLAARCRATNPQCTKFQVLIGKDGDLLVHDSNGMLCGGTALKPSWLFRNDTRVDYTTGDKGTFTIPEMSEIVEQSLRLVECLKVHE